MFWPRPSLARRQAMDMMPPTITKRVHPSDTPGWRLYLFHHLSFFYRRTIHSWLCTDSKIHGTSEQYQRRYPLFFVGILFGLDGVRSICHALYVKCRRNVPYCCCFSFFLSVTEQSLLSENKGTYLFRLSTDGETHPSPSLVASPVLVFLFFPSLLQRQGRKEGQRGDVEHREWMNPFSSNPIGFEKNIQKRGHEGKEKVELISFSTYVTKAYQRPRNF